MSRPGTPVGTELLFDDPCVVFALGRESTAFRREFRPHQRFPGAPCWARFCGPPWLSVLVVETGMGVARTEQALRWLLSKPRLGEVPYRPKVVLSAGCCGALREGLHLGDVVLATEVVDAAGGRWPTTWPGTLPPGPWQPPLIRERLLTVPQLAATPAAKKALGQEHAAAVVDMETAAVARMCHDSAIPFGSVRVVLDDVDTALSPRLGSLLSGGRASPWRLAAALLTAPQMMGELWRLAKHTNAAAEPLGQALGELLTLALPWAALPDPDS